MMIRIVKNGQTTFAARCDRCLCDFEYELADLSKKRGYAEYISCPCCGQDVRHTPIVNELLLSNSRGVDLTNAIGFQED